MKTIKGDLIDEFFAGNVEVLIHGCNCHNAMASGIAGQIAKRIPEAKLADDMYKKAKPIDKLSSFSYAIVRRGEFIPMGIVINLYTQFLPGKNLDINALLLGFTKLKHKISTNTKIGIPEIGCGIAGGDWTLIGPEIAKIMETHDITHVEYQPKK